MQIQPWRFRETLSKVRARIVQLEAELADVRKAVDRAYTATFTTGGN